MINRRRLRAPEHLPDHVSRAEAATLLGFASEFKVRQLERAGSLRAARGAMGSAWYPRAAVLALREDAAATARSAFALPIEPVRHGGRGHRRRSDADLIVYLRAPVPPGAPQRTVADLVADMGVTMARAQTVFRFWLAHDAHPSAVAVRAARGDRTSTSLPTVPEVKAAPSERRSPARVERAFLIRQLRAADPAVRTAAFDQLKRRRSPADAR